MARWGERASERLRDGERVETTVPVGDSGVVVTSQRVFAFTPEGEGPNFRAVERPNVENVSAGTTSTPDWLGYVGKAGLAGLVGVALGLTVDFEEFVDLGTIDAQGAGRLGMGGMLGLLQRLSAMLGMVDQVLLVGGLLSLALALGALGMYVESRTKTLQVAVAGDADLHVPATDRKDAVAQLRRALVGDADVDPAIDAATSTDAARTPDDPGPAPEAGPAITDVTDESADRGTLGTVLDSLRVDDDSGGDEAASEPPDEQP
ncbi:hypothetical protein [Halorientalis halophila]|uniref:hypothetical protein n=1 Tax=Halorientalis halophila TaxID=3108499 RepID=UPI00300B4459